MLELPTLDGAELDVFSYATRDLEEAVKDACKQMSVLSEVRPTAQFEKERAWHEAYALLYEKKRREWKAEFDAKYGEPLKD